MFVGDFVFNGSIGRTDLGGNEIDMKKSIETILSYDDSIRLYPGHYLSTTIGDERKKLRVFFLKCFNIVDWFFKFNPVKINKWY